MAQSHLGNRLYLLPLGRGGGLICVLYQTEPGAAQQYNSVSSGPCAATSAAPSERTKIEAARNVFLAAATCALRHREPCAAQ